MDSVQVKRKPGFTLVELLVVIGIIALLIAILLPALNRARLQARRTQDLSNIHQMAIACVAYAAENRGDWPLGSRNGPNLSNPPSTNDDLVWINSYTFGYFLQFMCNTATSQQWLSTTAPYPSGKPIDASVQRRFACMSLYDAPEVSNVGELTYRYLTLQTDPAGQGWTATYMGFIYWGRRAQEVSGNIYDQTRTQVSPATAYTFPLKQGQKSTSQTLITCPAYSSNGYSCYWPHSAHNDALVNYAKVTTPGNASPTDPSSTMQGICCAYTDGSARWVPRRQLWSLFETGLDWVYYDGTQH